MTTEDKSNVSEIKTEKAEDLLKSLETNATASGTVWKKLGEALVESGILNGRRHEDKKDHTKEFNKAFTTYLDKTVGSVVPSEGYDRTGKKLITLKKKDGSVKWSAWQVSSRMMQYLTELSAMQYYGEELFITDPVSLHSELKSRAEILRILDKYKASTTIRAEGLDSGVCMPAPEETTIAHHLDCLEKIMRIKELITKIIDPYELKHIQKNMEEAYIAVMNHKCS